jgi:hypothetical protein
MEPETLTLGKLLAKTTTLARRRILTLLGWGVLALLLCLPYSILIARDLVNLGSFDPVLLWRSLTPLGKLGMFLSTWFVSLGLMGLTQAVTTLVTWDDYAAKPTTLRNLVARLLPKLHRILGLQVLVFLMIVVLVPITIFAIPAILLENSRVRAGIGKSLKLLSRHAGKVIVVLLLALAIVIGVAVAWDVVPILQGGSLLYFAVTIELRMGTYYLAGVIIGIPTTLLFCETLRPPPPPAER